MVESPNIYRDERGRLYERADISGKRPMKRIPTDRLDEARQIVDARRRRHILWEEGVPGYSSPYMEDQRWNLRAILTKFVSAGAPSRIASSRGDATRRQMCEQLDRLVEWPRWSERSPETITIQDVDAYADWRWESGQVVKGRAIDMEIGALNQMLSWAVRKGLITRNPFSRFEIPKFYSGDADKCREHQPADAAELHLIAAEFFRNPKSVVLGFQYLLEAFTGLRTCEVLSLPFRAPPRSNGWIDWDLGNMRVDRAKKGVNPFVRITPELAELLKAIEAWHVSTNQDSRWLFPSPDLYDQPVRRATLTKALKRISAKVCGGKRLTSHGARAFYVTVRRSQGIADAIIADEIGDVTGAPMIVSTYGAIPPNWRDAKIPAMTFIPADGPAWKTLNLTL